MPDDEQSTPGVIPAAAQEFIAQLRSIAALQAQLSAFDQQLAVLEQILGPLGEWSSTWAEFEQRLLPRRPRPEAGDPGPATALPVHPAAAARFPVRHAAGCRATSAWPVLTR